MNAQDILKYGHRTVMTVLEGLTEPAVLKPGAVGVWSVKNIVAHLASFELLMEDVARTLSGGGPTPTLDAKQSHGDRFNDVEVAKRASMSYEEVVREYTEVHNRLIHMIRELPAERLRLEGTIPWYGPEYSVDDFIVYANYGHKREHCAQIKLFRRRGN